MDYYVEQVTPKRTFFFHCHDQNQPGPGFMCRSHIHSWVELIFVRRGQMDVMLSGQEFSVQDGALLVIPSNEAHQIYARTQQEHSYIVLKFQPDLLNTSMQVSSEYGCVLPFLLQGNEHRRVFHAQELENSDIPRLAEHMLREYQDGAYGYEIALKADFYAIILWILRQWQSDAPHTGSVTAEHMQRLQQVFAYVQEHYASDIDVRTMAQLCSVSYCYFSRFFQKCTGKSFVSYLNAVRLCAAERMLITTDYSITQIAMDSGFSDASYFTRCFTAKNGVSPNVYRKKYRFETKIPL